MVVVPPSFYFTHGPNKEVKRSIFYFYSISKLILNHKPMFYKNFAGCLILLLPKSLFFLSWFIHEHLLFTGSRGRGRVSPFYHFQPLHRYLDISRVITAESSPLHIASSRTRTEKPLVSEQ